MQSRWLAYCALPFVLVALSCKGGDDDTPPDGTFLEIEQTAPEPGSELVPVTQRIAVRVSAAIDPATVTSETFFLVDGDGTRVPSSVEILEEDPNAPADQVGTAAELTPAEELDILSSYTVTVTTGLTATNGSRLENDFSWSFSTLDAAWGEQSELIEPAELPTNSRAQDIAVDEQLSAVVVWEAVEDSGVTTILANRYTRRDLWGTPEPIDDGSGVVSSPKVALDADGNAFAVWERNIDTFTQNIWTNRYDVDALAWGTPELLQTGVPEDARLPAITADRDGNATAIWVELDPLSGRQVIRAIRYEPGSGWGEAETIARPVTLIAAAQTAIGSDDAGAVIAMWDPPAGPSGQGGRVLWSNRYVPGTGWGEPVEVKSDSLTRADVFRLAVGANGDAFAVWEQDNDDELEPRLDVWSARFSGDEWGAPERIDAADGGDTRAPEIAVDGSGTAYAVWSQADPDFLNIWAADYVPDSGWAAPVLVEPPNMDPTLDADATRPAIGTNRAGNVFVVWRQSWEQWESIWSNRRDPGTDWLTAERLENINSNADIPVVAVDEGRHAHAVWQQNTSSRVKLRTNRFE